MRPVAIIDCDLAPGKLLNAQVAVAVNLACFWDLFLDTLATHP